MAARKTTKKTTGKKTTTKRAATKQKSIQDAPAINSRRSTANPYIDIMDSGGGRPIKLISELGEALIETLAGFMCTDEEIAASMSDKNERISVDTLTNENNGATFAECKEKGQAHGKVSLRRNQFKLSESSAVMAIFLGKNYLDQTDKQEVKTELGGDGSIVFNIMPASMRPPEDEDESEE